jgi:Fe-S metabolism associated domain
VASTGRVGGQGDGATGSKQPEEAADFLAGKGLARRAVAAIAVRRQPQMQPNPTGRRSWNGDPNSRDLLLPSVDASRSDFAFLDDWEERYRYVLELGRTLEPLSEAAHNGANKVRGCVSQVWLSLAMARMRPGKGCSIIGATATLTWCAALPPSRLRSIRTARHCHI